MAHIIIIRKNGAGPGGTTESSVTWSPSHELTGNEQMRRVERAEKLLDKIDDILYAAPGNTD